MLAVRRVTERTDLLSRTPTLQAPAATPDRAATTHLAAIPAADGATPAERENTHLL